MHVGPVDVQVGLLDDPADVEDPVHVVALRREPADRRVVAREEVHQVEEPRSARAGIDGVGEGVEPPPAVGAVHVPEVDALGVAEADDLGRLEPASRWVAGRQVEVGVVAGEQPGGVVRGQSGGELAVGDELALDLGECGHGLPGVVRVDPPGSADRL